ncbi:MAG: hypothetical protein HND44_01635 [Chloroflexi bacterium]|nr:HNH endonuclease [Ardenticatenaceae bacterium]MBL1127200.1 hypothetical protein [Chloroflexota bacterium]NOG33262.1 hypothetical protein [Chloroflexota bacterium]GIK56082.1 MAG: hypothetical protein BroJett015_17450 [Chloroflexota bacterium]
MSSRIKIPETEIKILFAKSGNLCAFPSCQNPIIANEGDGDKPLAEMAHIIAYQDNGPRSDPSIPISERNKASNLILFCPTHHTIVDKFEYQYNAQVLREMKRLHEARFIPPKEKQIQSELKSEFLYASFLPISRLPFFVFSAVTPYRKSNILELFDILNTQEHKGALYAFELRDQRLYTFFDLREPNNPFRGAYDQTTVEVLKATDLWENPDSHRLYIALLNRSLTSYLKKRGVAYDAEHFRHYFLPDKTTVERKFTYKSLSGKNTSKSIVHNPTTKLTGLPKSYWIHLAANLSFQQVEERQWVFTIRPERHLTKDGYDTYTHSSIGSKITRIKSKMYNWEYLQEIQLWREFLTNAKPRLYLSFGKQSIVIENVLLKEEIRWIGVPDDEKDFVSQQHPEDLFSFAESQSFENAEDDFDGDLFLGEFEDV